MVTLNGSATTIAGNASTGSPVTLQLSQILGNDPSNCYPPGTVTGCNTQ
jgi:hypothetical protein